MPPVSASDGARLYRDAMALAGVLLTELDRGRSHTVLRERLARGVIRLFDFVVLAMGARRPPTERVRQAANELLMLRAQLRLGHALRVVDEDTFLALAEQCERIQGGLAALGPARAHGVH